MSHEQEQRRSERRRQTRAFRAGLALSIALHVLLFALFAGQRLPPSPFSAAGERRGDDRAALGGGLQLVQLGAPAVSPPPTPDPVPEEAVEEEPEEVPEEEPEEPSLDVPAIALAMEASLGGNRGPDVGAGLAAGDGRGDGGTEMDGRFRVVPPRPRGLILPPSDRPGSVRGKEIEVWVYVAANGQVVADSTRLNPSTGDRGFDRRLREHAAGWVFEAAVRNGRPVGEWFRYEIIL